ncbi:EH signature domain-containing protein [Methylobacterium sp. C33D]
MQVKSAIAEIRTRPSTFPALPTTAALAMVAQEIPAPTIEVEPAPPPDLDQIATRIIQAFSAGAVPERRDVNLAPWCLWDGKRPLVREPTVLARFLAHVRTASRKSTFRRLASAYIVRFDPSEADRPTSALNDIAATLRDLASRMTGPLTEAARHLNLFDPRTAPRTIAGIALDRKISPSRVLADFGIQNLGAEAGLAEAAFLAGLDRQRTDRSLSPQARLASIQAWGTRQDGSVIFEHRRGTYVDALVLPLADVDVDRTAMDATLKFLVARFGDPRLKQARWQPMTSKSTVLKWLTALSLRQFLDVVDQGAYDFQWRYRRAFWEAVHRRGLIDDAWVVFDEVGDRTAKRLFDVKAPYARWTSGGRKPIERGHAVLLLKVGRGVVAEWSHNGRCNIWHDRADPTAPALSKSLYDTDEVRVGRQSTPQFKVAEITHAGSEGYNWQVKVANEIFLLTNVRVMESEYRV